MNKDNYPTFTNKIGSIYCDSSTIEEIESDKRKYTKQLLSDMEELRLRLEWNRMIHNGGFTPEKTDENETNYGMTLIPDRDEWLLRSIRRMCHVTPYIPTPSEKKTSCNGLIILSIFIGLLFLLFLCHI